MGKGDAMPNEQRHPLNYLSLEDTLIATYI